jgi:ketosteroid isomerase-like protein
MVWKAFEAYSAGGIESLLPFYAPDVVLYPDPEWPEDSVYEGHRGDKVSRARSYLDQGEALRAPGLSESSGQADA